MIKFYPPSYPASLTEIKNDEKKRSFLFGVMQVIFVLSLLLLVFLALAKAKGV